MLMEPRAVGVLPIWLSGLVLTGGAVLGAIVVELVARRLFPREIRAEHNAVAAAMFAVVGTTYAVLLAFVAMLAWEGYNKAQAATDYEASFVENVYQLLSGQNTPEMISMRSDIVAYARHIIAVEWPTQARGLPVPAQDQALRRLIEAAIRVHPNDTADSNVRNLLLEQLTELSAARRERLIAARTSIPTILWFVLLAGGAITVSFASLLGAPRLAMHLAMSSLLALSGALVLLVIVALSSPFEGDLAISDEPFHRVLVEMTE
jgi:hypothetical protein